MEFAEPPRCSLDVFRRALDETLMELSIEYRTRREAARIEEPHLIELPAGIFHRWLSVAGRLGVQRTVPRLTNDRAVADSLLTAAARSTSLARPRSEVLAAP